MRVDGRLERLDVLVRRAGLDEDLGARRPQHDQAVALLLLAEAVDVLADRVEHGALVDRADGVVGVDALHVLTVEGGLHRADVAQRVGDLLDVLAALEHAGAAGRDVGVVRERIPRAEDDVVEIGEGHELLDQRSAAIGALAETDGVHLGEAADGLAESLLHQLDAGDEGGRDGAEAHREHAEAAGGGGD